MKKLIFALLASSLMSTVVSAQETERPLAEQGYCGITLRDIPNGHSVISWLFPGPINGQGLDTPDFDLSRPDLVVSVNDKKVNAEQFKNLVRAASPGDELVIKYRKSKSRGGTIPTELNHEEEVRIIKIVLDSRETWSGTFHRKRGHDTTVVFEYPLLLDPHDSQNILGAEIIRNNLSESTDVLLGVFTQWMEKDDDFHSLSRVRAGFENPFALNELQQLVTDPMKNVPENPLGEMVKIAAANLDVVLLDNQSHGSLTIDTPLQGLLALDYLLSESTLMVMDALGDNYNDEVFAKKCLAMLRVPKQTFYIQGPSTRDHVEVMRRSMDVDFSKLIAAFEHLDVDIIINEAVAQAEADELPAELIGAIDGPILAAQKLERVGWIVVGSAEANRYDMSKVAGVIDVGGNDEYYATDLRLGNSVIIDIAGDDKYSGTADQGPASALLGISYIDDRAGNDHYQGKLLSTGAAMFGISLLLDRSGEDIYMGSEWSIGAACYGAGIIVDLSNSNDTYLGDFLCQGVGGPRGFGCIIDENGRDLYRANGPTPSAYGTAAVYQSFSQGMGFGFRQYAAGGIGVISDLGGDDRYEAGEFAQGGAYFYGLGILHDASGRDLYYGSRYSQGFGVHQAMGVLSDDAGDDTYWSMTAASQGAAWDIGSGLLIDRAGNDSYQCDGLGQGGASMQGIAILADLAGTDRYAASGAATQGRSGGDSYHFHETGAYSLSILLDLGGTEDWYSSGRSQGSVEPLDKISEKNTQNSNQHGLFIDR